ncbi:MAG: hypothetical protein V1698_02090 [bacterium]
MKERNRRNIKENLTFFLIFSIGVSSFALMSIILLNINVNNLVHTILLCIITISFVIMHLLKVLGGE